MNQDKSPICKISQLSCIITVRNTINHILLRHMSLLNKTFLLPKGQMSYFSTPNDSYKQISPYLEKPFLLGICSLDGNLENVRRKNTVSCAL